MSTMNPILEGSVKYRDGKKWKRRYCVLCLPSKNLSVLHLYLGKTSDDFQNASFRCSTGSGGHNHLPASSPPNSTSNSSSRSSVSVFQSLTARASNYYCNLAGGGGSSHSTHVSDPVAEMCNAAERAVAADLETAATGARTRGHPLPTDAVTGFETGCHLGGESNVLLLIGWKTVHPIALHSVDEMFTWAEVLEQTLIDSNYHVTLCRVGSASDNSSASSCILPLGGGTTNSASSGGGGGNMSGLTGGLSSSSGGTLSISSGAGAGGTNSSGVGGGTPVSGPLGPLSVSTSGVPNQASSSSSGSSSSSKLQVGLQASLHVQQWRLCLIGEPSAGCQFIAQWRLDALDAAYTMETNCSGSSSSGGSAFPLYDAGFGCGFTPPSGGGLFGAGAFNTPVQKEDRFFLEANRSAGKGLIGNYVFQVDCRRLAQLSQAIGDLMVRRFPALTAPPGTRVLPSGNPPPDDSDLGRSAAIDIRGKSIFGRSTTAGNGRRPTGTTVPGPSVPATATGVGTASLSPPHTSALSPRAFTPSSLPSRPLAPPPPVSEESHRAKKSSHWQFFGTQTLDRSDAIKIPSRRITTALARMTGDRGRSSSKEGSAGSAGSSEPSLIKTQVPQPALYYPSVMVGAGIITSLVPAPQPTPSQIAFSGRPETFGGGGAPISRYKPPPPPPPPPPPSPPQQQQQQQRQQHHRRSVCDRCQRRRTGHQKLSSTSNPLDSGGVFDADEDVELLPPAPLRIRPPPSEIYSLYKQLYRTVKPFHRSPRSFKNNTLDSRPLRRSRLVRERVFEVLAGGEGSILDRLLLGLSPTESCVFLLAFAPPHDPLCKEELKYRWYLVHRPGNCCARCCLWRTPILQAELNLQDVVAQQVQLLKLGRRAEVTKKSLKSIPCGGEPCLVTSKLCVWRFGKAGPFGDACNSHVRTTTNNLSRPWSVLYLGPDGDLDDSPSSPFEVSSSSSLSSTTSSKPCPCCIYCGCLLYSSNPTHRRTTQSVLETCSLNQSQSSSSGFSQSRSQQHSYANLVRNGKGASTFPAVSRRSHQHHQTAPVVFPGKPVASAARDVPDGVDRRGRGATSTYSTSCSTSQASSPSSPQGHASYCNITAIGGFTSGASNPLKYPVPHPQVDDRPLGAYVNLQHLYGATQNRWRGMFHRDQVPDEIREPKRNYALVDLRPSPANSVLAPGETLTLVSTCEDNPNQGNSADGSSGGANNSETGSIKTDSSASTVRTNTSTSSAATIVPSNTNRPRTSSQHRRTSSHSLITVLPVPTLNYVHIMTKKDVAGSCESPISSSAASSLTASSSEKEQTAPTASNTAVVDQIPYAQIDFERTRALNAVNNGTLEAFHGFHNHHGHGKLSTGMAPVGLRGLNMRKRSDGL